MLIDKTRIGRLIPHAGAMCLLDGVSYWDEEKIRCTATSHLDRQNPLRRSGRLSAICAVEYAAQAMALHAALNSRDGAAPRPGYLASLREVVCRVSDLDREAGELAVEAGLLLADANRVIYSFRVRCDERLLVTGQAAVVLGTGR